MKIKILQGEMKMLKNFSIFVLVFYLIAFPSLLYGKKGNSPKELRGAGIGKEVSREARTLKECEEKENFGEWVRERARDKQRIEIHKEMTKKQRKKRRKREKENKFNID